MKESVATHMKNVSILLGMEKNARLEYVIFLMSGMYSLSKEWFEIWKISKNITQCVNGYRQHRE